MGLQEIFGLLVVVIWIGSAIYEALAKKKIIKEKQLQPEKETAEQDEYKRYLEEVKRRLQEMSQTQEAAAKVEEITPAKVKEPPPKPVEKEIKPQDVELTLTPIYHQTNPLEEKVLKNDKLTSAQKAFICKEIFARPRTVSILKRQYTPLELIQ